MRHASPPLGSGSVRVVGRRDEHLGPRREVAQIEIVVEPADTWHVQLELDERARSEMQRYHYIDAAVQGIVDVLTEGSGEITRKGRLRFVGAKVHPIHSSQHAFRMAGRDAALKLLKVLDRT